MVRLCKRGSAMLCLMINVKKLRRKYLCSFGSQFCTVEIDCMKRIWSLYNISAEVCKIETVHMTYSACPLSGPIGLSDKFKFFKFMFSAKECPGLALYTHSKQYH